MTWTVVALPARAVTPPGGGGGSVSAAVHPASAAAQRAARSSVGVGAVRRTGAFLRFLVKV